MFKFPRIELERQCCAPDTRNSMERCEIGAYIAKILPGGCAEQTGRLIEGKNKDFKVN